ncbi:MAG: hypothetical protein G01um101472_275, partial [Parcubacteria group bacterium Gr01-1014_72]
VMGKNYSKWLTVEEVAALDEKLYLKSLRLHHLYNGTEHLFFLLNNRTRHTGTNILTPQRFLEYAINEVSEVEEWRDLAKDDVKHIFRRGATLSARQFAIERVGEIEGMERVLPGIVRRAARSALTGYEERHQLVSLFHREEGIPGGDGARNRRRFHLGTRPFRQSNPYLFVTYRLTDSDGAVFADMHLRGYIVEWEDISRWTNVRLEYIAEVPLIRNVGIVGGISIRPDSGFREEFPEDPIIASAGVRVGFRQGTLYIGGGYPKSALLICSFLW